MFPLLENISGLFTTMVCFVSITVALTDSLDTNIPSVPMAHYLNARFKRQFDGSDFSLGQTVQGLQQAQQAQNSRPGQQNQNSNTGFNQQPGGGFDQFQSGSAQFPSWNNPNIGNQGTLNSNNQNAQAVIRPQTTQRPVANQISNQNTVNEAECIRNCPATNQWNPVCGTDNISYGNVNKLRCAQQCGRQVTFVYNGSCVTTPPPNK